MGKKLSVRQILVTGGAVFSMHFGASCMLYAVTWGKESGNRFLTAFIGILLSGIILPALAYVAMARGGGDFKVISSRASARFSTFFCGVTAIVLGPLYIIPRMCAASWDALTQLTGWTPKTIFPALIFSLLFFSIIYWFVSSKSKTVGKVGNLLFPVLVVMVALFIIKGIVTPINPWRPDPSYDQPPILYGFLQGYATGDIQCALFFGPIIIEGIRSSGVPEKRIPGTMVVVGVIGFAILAAAHFGHMCIGSTIGDTIPLTLSRLYTEMALILWGGVGGIFFCVALNTAALTCTIGLTASTSEYWETELRGKVPYKVIVVLTAVCSCLLSLMGMDAIVTVVAPILDACYPAAIVLVLYYVLMPHFESERALRALKWAMITACVFGALGALAAYARTFQILGNALALYERIPLAKQNLAWVPFSALAFAGVLLAGKRRCRGELAAR